MEAAPPQPKDEDSDAAVYFKLALTVLYYICYPVYKVGHVILLLLLQLLKPIWAVVRFITLPFAYVAAFTGHMLYLPFQLIAKFETLYIFLGIAVLIGLATGAVLALLASFTNSTLQLDTAGRSSQPERLRSLASFRAARKRRTSVEAPPPLPLRPVGKTQRIQLATPLSPASSGPGSVRARGLLSSTILEEDDSDESETAS